MPDNGVSTSLNSTSETTVVQVAYQFGENCVIVPLGDFRYIFGVNGHRYGSHEAIGFAQAFQKTVPGARVFVIAYEGEFKVTDLGKSDVFKHYIRSLVLQEMAELAGERA